MFSAKNYGLPKDLIEAAKRVHEKQLMEYDEDGYINNPPKGMDKGTKKDREKAAKMGLKGPHLEGEGRVTKKQKQNIPQSEEVQFTEEDLDYVFENEFPQWLEESLSQAFARPERTGKSAQKAAKLMGRDIISQSSQDAQVGLTRAARQDIKGISSRRNILKANPPTTKTDQTTREGRPVTSGGTLPSSVVQGDTEGRYTSAPVPKQKPTPRKQVKVSAKPSASDRKQTGGPSLFQQAKKAVRPTPGDPGRTAINRLNYMARRGNKPSQQALKGPKKDWRASVFNPDGN